MMARLAELGGLLRSFLTYRRPGRQRGLRRLYARFVAEGDLVFDVGAHLGDRTTAFRSLGARVVALEPQPRLADWLERLVGRHPRVTVRREAVGAAAGRADLAVSRSNPTVSTLADRWRKRIPDANPGFRDVRWEDSVEVPVTTLDALIEEFGVPSFCKIDVEGFEAEVLSGLSRPLPALSVEFVAGSLEVPLRCIALLEARGTYRYNAIPGERRDFIWDEWRPADGAAPWLRQGADGIPSGDLYARFDGDPIDAGGDGEGPGAGRGPEGEPGADR